MFHCMNFIFLKHRKFSHFERQNDTFVAVVESKSSAKNVGKGLLDRIKNTKIRLLTNSHTLSVFILVPY